MKIRALTQFILLGVVALTYINGVESVDATEVRAMLKVAVEVFGEQMKSNTSYDRCQTKTQQPVANTSGPGNGDWDKYRGKDAPLAVMIDELKKLKADIKRRIRDLETDYIAMISHANEITDEEQKKGMVAEIQGTLYSIKQIPEMKKLIEDEPAGGQPQTLAGPDGQPGGHPGAPGQPAEAPAMPGSQQPGSAQPSNPGSNGELGGKGSEEGSEKKHSSKKRGSKKSKDKKKHGKHDKKGKEKKGKKPSRPHRKSKKKNDRGGKGKHH